MTRHLTKRSVKLRRCNANGFALIETIIAFSVLALGLGATMIAVATAMRSDSHARNGRIMGSIAQARMEAAGISDKLIIGRRQGMVGQFSWKEVVTPARIAPDPKQDKSIPQADPGLVPVWVEISVSASDGSEEKLSALKLSPRQQ